VTPAGKTKGPLLIEFVFVYSSEKSEQHLCIEKLNPKTTFE
jgi:hypothetical protein